MTKKHEKTNDTPDKEASHASEMDLLKDQFFRLQAEYANFKRRTDEERSQVYEMGARDVLSGVVKVLDDFELALRNANDLESFKKGMEMIYANIISTGEEFGLERIKTAGEQFDPTRHEALLTEESDKKPQTILEELQSGYEVKGKVIRTAKVKVAR
ncbi:MAG: nucleotide exchange factor GrpE [Nanoarchaeota archaeon]|nr:nucleotide exchange factor GrpE [Nanoarchaeota archaeon]